MITAIIILAFGLIFNFIPVPGPASLAFRNISLGLLAVCAIGDNPIMAYLLPTGIVLGIGIITGTLVGLRTKNKVRVGVAIGTMPDIIVAISAFYILILMVESWYQGMVLKKA
jgi:hypothetical protein